MIALKPEFHTLASQLLDHNWLVEEWGQRASLGKEKGPPIPVVASGSTGDDPVCRHVVAGSGAVARALFREG